MGDTLDRYCDTASYCHIGELVYAANPPPLVISASLLDVEHAISSLEDESCDESERERLVPNIQCNRERETYHSATNNSPIGTN